MEEKVPKESETIAAKREARLAEKISQARARIGFPAAWWTQDAGEAAALGLVFAVSFVLALPFFGKADPGTTFAAPVIPIFAKGISFVFGIPYTYSVNIVYLLSIIFFPLTFYFFVHQVTGRKLAALAAAAFANLPTEPFLLTRLKSTILGDGPYIASLTIIPLAILTHLSFLRGGGMRNLAFAAGFSALVLLISPFGTIILLIFLTIATFSEMLLGRGRLKTLRATVVFLISLGLAAFWYNPDFLRLLFEIKQGQEVVTTFGKLVPISFFVVPILGVLGFLIFERRPQLQPLFLALFTTIVFGLIILVGAGVFPSHPTRYTSGFGIALSLLLGVITLRGMDLVRLSPRVREKFTKTWLGRPIFSDAFPIVVILLLFGLALAGRNATQEVATQQVLGLWTDVARGKLWLVREETSGLAALSGYFISLVTVGILGIFSLSARRRHP